MQIHNAPKPKGSVPTNQAVYTDAKKRLIEENTAIFP